MILFLQNKIIGIMKRILFSSVIILASLSACKKENTSLPIQARTFEINSTGSTKWKYFSLTINDTVTVTDPIHSNTWDLAFQRYRIKTNGGESGSGSGSAANSYQKGQTGFDALKIVSDTTTFMADNSISIAVQQGYTTYVVNPVLYTWFAMEFATQGTQIVPSDYIYIVKTSSGKYAKVWFKSYYSATNVSGYVSFQYKYQPDGSKNLE
jgi:hypothetical protein